MPPRDDELERWYWLQHEDEDFLPGADDEWADHDPPTGALRHRLVEEDKRSHGLAARAKAKDWLQELRAAMGAERKEE